MQGFLEANPTSISSNSVLICSTLASYLHKEQLDEWKKGFVSQFSLLQYIICLNMTALFVDY